MDFLGSWRQAGIGIWHGFLSILAAGWLMGGAVSISPFGHGMGLAWIDRIDVVFSVD